MSLNFFYFCLPRALTIPYHPIITFHISDIQLWRFLFCLFDSNMYTVILRCTYSSRQTFTRQHIIVSVFNFKWFNPKCPFHLSICHNKTFETANKTFLSRVICTHFWFTLQLSFSIIQTKRSNYTYDVLACIVAQFICLVYKVNMFWFLPMIQTLSHTIHNSYTCNLNQNNNKFYALSMGANLCDLQCGKKIVNIKETTW